MNRDLQLAVNRAVNDAWSAIARARYSLLGAGMGSDSKRASAWCEYGFKDVLEYRDLYKLYRRGGIANGAVNKRISRVWHTNPQIIEGE